MNLVYGLALHEFSIAQRIEHPPGVWEVIGSNPVGDSEFFFVPCSWHADYFIFTRKHRSKPLFFLFFVTSIDLTQGWDWRGKGNVTWYLRGKQVIKFVNTSNLGWACLFSQHKCKVRVSTSCTALLLGASTIVTESKKVTIFMITYTYNEPLFSFT